MAAARRKRIGRYLVGPRLGEGGMATVYVGRLQGPGGFTRTVAIKMLKAERSEESQPDAPLTRVDELMDEARIAARVTHPNVVSVLDVITENDVPHLIMEYVEGVSFGHLLVKHGGPLQPDIAAAVMRDALAGLDAAHETKDDDGASLDIVHRDVTPRNILVGSNGIARIADFGIAKAVGTTYRTRTGLRRGTVRYMSPEHVRGDPLTRQTDVFSAGVVLWEALTGRPLFGADNDVQVLVAIMDRPIEPPSRHAPVPAALDAVVMRALDRDPSARFLTAAAMVRALERAITPASAATVSAWVRRTAGDVLLARASAVATGVDDGSGIDGIITLGTNELEVDDEATTMLMAPEEVARFRKSRRSWWMDRRMMLGVALVGGLALLLLVAALFRPTPSIPPAAALDASGVPLPPKPMQDVPVNGGATP